MDFEPIRFEQIVNTSLFWQNPSICFLSPKYQGNLTVNNNGEEIELKHAVNYCPFLEIGLKKKRFGYILYASLISLLFSFITSLFGTVINFGPDILPKEPGYWKYMILQLSILSAFLFGFSSVFEIIYSNNNWTNRCTMNSIVMQVEKKARCDCYKAKQDVIKILSNCNTMYVFKDVLPYGDFYFDKIIDEIQDISFKNNLIEEYNKQLSIINSRSSLLKCIVSFLIGVSIEIFSFIDLFNDLQVFRTNMIVSGILIIVLSFFLSWFVVKNRFEKAYIKMDSLLYLYSYIFLDMPFSKENPQIIFLDEEKAADNDYINQIIEQLSASKNKYIYSRQIEIIKNKVIFYKI